VRQQVRGVNSSSSLITWVGNQPQRTGSNTRKARALTQNCTNTQKGRLYMQLQSAPSHAQQAEADAHPCWPAWVCTTNNHQASPQRPRTCRRTQCRLQAQQIHWVGQLPVHSTPATTPHTTLSQVSGQKVTTEDNAVPPTQSKTKHAAAEQHRSGSTHCTLSPPNC
jgi:hypothetical protein